MDDYLHIEFSPVEQMGHGFVRNAQEVRQITGRLESAIEDLYASGLRGSFVGNLNARCQGIFSAFRLYSDKNDEIGEELLAFVRMARQLDAEYAHRFADTGHEYHAPGGQSIPLNGYAGGGLGGGGGGSWGIDTRRVEIGDFPNSRFPTQTELLREYLGGNLTYDQARRLMMVASKDRQPRNFLDAKAVLWDNDFLESESAVDQRVLLDGKYGTITGSILASELAMGTQGAYGDDGLEADIHARAGDYLYRLQGSGELLGFDAVGDAYVGATAAGSAGFTWDPRGGEVKAVAKGEAFIGVEATGSVVLLDNRFLSVEAQGSVLYGVGAKGRFEAYSENGELYYDVGALVSPLGLGTGGGLKVRLDVQECAEFTVEQASLGVVYLTKSINDTLDAVLP